MTIAAGKRIGRAYALSFAVWCVFALLGAWQYHLFDQDLNMPIPVVVRIALAQSNGFASALLTPPLFWLVRRNSESTKPPIAALIYAGVLGLFMLSHSALLWVMYHPWQDAVRRYIPRIDQGPLELIRSGFASLTTTYIAILVAAHAYVYFQRVRKQDLERHEFQQALAASELESLKLQLHPRFLFSALDGISSLVDTDGRTAKDMIVKLSTLLRTALQHSGSDLISLEEELKFVREYVDLEKMRLGAALTVDWSIAPETRAILVPQLILQPLVENAIRSGMGPRYERSRIEISSRKEGKMLELCVRNGTAAPIADSEPALQNTDARLQHLYAGDARLTIDVDDERRLTTKIIVPALGLEADAGAPGTSL